MRLKSFIENDWSQFADYDNRRSLPHLIDGLKISQRKVLHTFVDVLSKDKPTKVSQAGARAAEYTSFHHGEDSIFGALIGMAQDFPGSNNFPLLQKHGQFGSRLSPKSSQPRYIKASLHSNWHKFFNKVDQQIVIEQFDEEDKIEPEYFIPVVPIILLNGASGVGNGYSSSILQYDLKAVVGALRELNKHGSVKKPLIPSVNGWKGIVEKNDRQVVFKGTYKVVNTTTIHITELPPGYTSDSYKKVLNTLIEKKLIKDYDNESTEDGWMWIIDTYRTTTQLSHDKLEVALGIISKDTENFVCWGLDTTRPMVFDSPEELITQWYTDRVTLYEKGRLKQIEILEEKVSLMEFRIAFIEWCLMTGFSKLTRAEMITKSVAQIKDLTEQLASTFSAMPLYQITTDEIEKLKKNCNTTKTEIQVLETKKAEDILIENLKGL